MNRINMNFGRLNEYSNFKGVTFSDPTSKFGASPAIRDAEFFIGSLNGCYN